MVVPIRLVEEGLTPEETRVEWREPKGVVVTGCMGSFAFIER